MFVVVAIVVVVVRNAYDAYDVVRNANDKYKAFIKKLIAIPL